MPENARPYLPRSFNCPPRAPRRATAPAAAPSHRPTARTCPRSPCCLSAWSCPDAARVRGRANRVGCDRRVPEPVRLLLAGPATMLTMPKRPRNRPRAMPQVGRDRDPFVAILVIAPCLILAIDGTACTGAPDSPDVEGARGSADAASPARSCSNRRPTPRSLRALPVWWRFTTTRTEPAGCSPDR